MRAATCLAAALLISACGSETSGEFETESGEQGSYSIDENNGETVARITTDEGTAEMRSGANVPVNLPKGFSIYPGAKVVSNTTITQNNGKGALIAFEVDASPDEIAEYYRKQAEDAGIDISLEMSVNDGKMLAGEGNDGETFTLNVSKDDAGSTGQLMVGEKLGR